MSLRNRTDLNELVPGDYIWCKYTAPIGEVGVFTDVCKDLEALGYTNPPMVSFNSIASTSDGTNLYVIVDTYDVTYNIKVKKFDGTAWTDVGGILNYRQDKHAFHPFIKTDGTNIYACWIEYNATDIFQIRVKKFDGTNWSFIDGNGVNGLNYNTANAAAYSQPKIEIIGTDVFVIWKEGYALRIKKYDGTSWTRIENDNTYGIGGTVDGAVNSFDVKAAGTTLYVSYSDANGYNRVKKYNSGTSWTYTHVSYWMNYDGNKETSYTTLTYFGGNLYSAWIEGRSIRVKRYDGGTNWTFIDGNGVDGLNYNWMGMVYLTLTATSTDLYISTCNNRAVGSQQMEIFKWNGLIWTNIVDGVNGVNYDIYTSVYHPRIEFINSNLYAINRGSNSNIEIKRAINGRFPELRVIPAGASKSPDSYFKLIYTGEDYLGRKKMIADRSIQNNISWNTLNSYGISTGNGLKLNGVKNITKSTSCIPIMTGYSNAVGNVFSKTYYGGSHPWCAFNGNLTDNYKSGVGAPQFIGYKFNTYLKCINKYSILSNATTGPKNWTFQGSLDTTDGTNGTWVDLDSRNNETSWSTKRTFEFSNTTNYIAYRIYITLGINANGIDINEIEFFEGYRLGMPVLNGKTVYMRLLTGGVSLIDKDNEWDKIIVESNLGGAITAGDDKVWNWSSNATLTSTTEVTDTTSRIIRGYGALGTYNYAASSSAVDDRSFRPVFMINSLISSKYLIKDGSAFYKVIDGVISIATIAGSIPTEEEFQTEGMSDLITITDAHLSDLTNPKVLYFKA